jgi:formylglycine-generating enzyme required for sulfatase activity/Tol biopolymer transport system component
VLLYAQSGAGKTSLLNAKLIPMLRDEEGLEVLPVARVRGEVPEEVQPEQIENLFVFNTLLDWMESGEDPTHLVGLSLSAFLQERPRPKDEEGQPTLRVVIFDQFEELFTLYPERWTEREGFFAQVADALSKDSFLRVLFVMREDYLAQLDPYVSLLPERLRNRFRLERLRREAALAAVTGPLVDTERSFASGVAESLVEELLKIRVETRVGETVEVPGEFVEPVQLQVVCRGLWEELPLEATEITLVGATPLDLQAFEEPSPEVTEITLEHLRRFGDVDQALLTFYERALDSTVQQAKVGERKLREWFERDLITPMGTRGTAYRGAESTGGVPNVAVDVLESQHIIRAERRAGARWYELTHDRFIRPIQRSNEAWHTARRERWRRIGGGVAVVLVLLLVGIAALLTSRSRQEVAQAQATATVAAARASEAKATATVIAAELSEAKALRSGMSIGGVESTAGTIGCFVMDLDGQPYLLSAADVLGEPDYELDAAVLQPGPTDGGQAPNDVVGYFAKYLPLTDGVSAANLVGLARLEEGIKFETAIPGLGPIRGVRDPVLGSTVYKLGRTTGLTKGQITQVDMTFSMKTGGGKTIKFRDGIDCSFISEGGDGGALVVDDEGYAIGIVVGASEGKTTLAPMQKVLNILGVRLLYSGAVRVWEKDNSEMVYVPAGEFTMGSDDSSSLADDDEKPQYSAYLDAFWMDRTEVTNAAFARFVEETGYQSEAEKADEAGWRAYAEGKDSHPVVKVTWKDANTYCRWAGKRLPTEAEWEKAAKGIEGFIYPWGDEWDPAKANTKEGGLRSTVAVGSFPEGTSPYGVFDMAGNVWEWTADWYQPYPESIYRSEYFGEEFKVTRGGGWFQDAGLVTTSNRSATDPKAANDDLGFRCAESPVVAEMGLWLAEGCDREYEPGFSTQVFFWASVDGQVTVWLDEEELLFEREVVGGETYQEDWQVVEEPEEHRLTAVLDLGQERLVSSGECRFFVESPVEITPLPTLTIKASATPTALPTFTPTPSPMPTPTPTPTPTLAPKGKIAFTLWDGVKYNVWVANVDGTSRALIIGEMRQPAFSRDGSKIAVNGEAAYHDNLHVANADGSNLIAVSEHLEDSRPNWSPDGNRIVFDSTAYGDRKSRIYILDDVTKRTDGRVLRSAGSDTFGRDPCWLPDGRIVYNGCDYWVDNTNCGLYIVPSGGSVTPTQLTTDSSDMAPAAHGNKITFMSIRDGNWEIYSMNTDGSGLKRLTNNGVNDGLPTFSPDGQFIAFVSDEGGQWAIWFMNAEGSGRQKLFDLNGGYGSGEEYDWTTERISWAPSTMLPFTPATPTVALSLSPPGRLLFARRIEGDTYLHIMEAADGSDLGRFPSDNPPPLGDTKADYSWVAKRFVFTRGEDEHLQIYTMDEGGGDRRNISSNEWNEWSPAWSPDGKRIAFVSDRDGNAEIYVMSDDGSAATRLTSDQANDLIPS